MIRVKTQEDTKNRAFMGYGTGVHFNIGVSNNRNSKEILK